jgi:predicted permease
VRWIRSSADWLQILRWSPHDADLREEIEAHRALRQAALEREGLGPDAAARESSRAMGNVTLAVEDARDVWAIRVFDGVRQDVRAAVRGLRKSAGASAVVIGTLALGIGANTSLFSIFNSLIMRPLPVRDPGSLALVSDGSWSYPVWQEIKVRETHLFDGAFAWSRESFDLAQDGRPVPVDGAYVSGRFFEVLGVSAFRGRMLRPADDSAAPPDGPVAVISHRFWRQRFGGADDVVGRELTVLNQRQRFPFTVVGIMPPGFSGVDVGRMADVMLPFAAEPLLQGRESALQIVDMSWLEMMVRLKPGQTIEHANAALRSVQPLIRDAVVPGLRGDPAFAARYLTDPFTLEPASAGASRLRSQFETPLVAMVVAVGLVLLVACANIASLLLARALTRREELSVRLALGGSRGRLARLLFIESLLVAMTGAALGLVFAKWSSALLVQQLGTWDSRISLDLALDWRVLLFTTTLACLCAISAGMAPMIAMRSVAPSEALKAAGRTMTGDRRFAVRGALVIAQIAVSFVLVIAAGLFLRTFASLNQLPLGFTPEPLVVVDMNLFASGIPPEERGARVERLQQAAAEASGVRSVSVSQRRMLTGGGWFTNNRIAVGGGPMLPEDRGKRVWRNATTPGWFETMAIPLRSGRDFNDRDRAGSPPVAIVNEAFVRRYLRGQPPIGQTLRVNTDPGPRHEVVGVVADAVYTTPRDGMLPTLYVPLAQREPREWSSWRNAVLTIKAEPGQRAMVERDVATALAQADSTLVFTLVTFDQMLDATMTQERLVAMMSGFFGALALLLAGLGLYGIVAQGVSARRTEVGLRIALGALPTGIVRLAFLRVAALIVSGLALGLAGSWWAARFVAPLLFQVEARDPMTFSGTAAVLVAVGALAAWLPARHAARLDPATVLREGQIGATGGERLLTRARAKRQHLKELARIG